MITPYLLHTMLRRIQECSAVPIPIWPGLSPLQITLCLGSVKSDQSRVLRESWGSLTCDATHFGRRASSAIWCERRGNDFCPVNGEAAKLFYNSCMESLPTTVGPPRQEQVRQLR